MNEYWHIPRASLVPSVTSSAVSSISSSDRSNKSFSNPPTLAERTTKVTTTKQKSRINNYLTPVNYKTNNRRNKNEQHNIAVIGAATPKPSQQYHLQHPQTHHHQLQVKRQATYSSPASVKRGSRSSQGSNDSNNSTRSAASGSLLLTAANLERFAEIQKQDSKNQNGYLPSVHNQYHQHSKQSIPSTHHATTTAVASGAASVVDNHTPHHHDYKMDDTIYNNKKSNRSTNSNSNNNFIDEDGNNVEGNIMHNNHHNDSIIQMDPNLNFIKTKDLDTVSIASSMHFTMVNGESGQTKKPKRGLCDRGRQVTVLIVSMSTIFMLLIMGMVYALEMRAREMPQS